MPEVDAALLERFRKETYLGYYYEVTLERFGTVVVGGEFGFNDHWKALTLRLMQIPELDGAKVKDIMEHTGTHVRRLEVGEK